MERTIPDSCYTVGDTDRIKIVTIGKRSASYICQDIFYGIGCILSSPMIRKNGFFGCIEIYAFLRCEGCVPGTNINIFARTESCIPDNADIIRNGN